jgi:hypothetical protein
MLSVTSRFALSMKFSDELGTSQREQVFPAACRTFAVAKFVTRCAAVETGEVIIGKKLARASKHFVCERFSRSLTDINPELLTGQTQLVAAFHIETEVARRGKYVLHSDSYIPRIPNVQMRRSSFSNIDDLPARARRPAELAREPEYIPAIRNQMFSDGGLVRENDRARRKGLFSQLRPPAPWALLPDPLTVTDQWLHVAMQTEVVPVEIQAPVLEESKQLNRVLVLERLDFGDSRGADLHVRSDFRQIRTRSAAFALPILVRITVHSNSSGSRKITPARSGEQMRARKESGSADRVAKLWQRRLNTIGRSWTLRRKPRFEVRNDDAILELHRAGEKPRAIAAKRAARRSSALL